MYEYNKYKELLYVPPHLVSSCPHPNCDHFFLPVLLRHNWHTALYKFLNVTTVKKKSVTLPELGLSKEQSIYYMYLRKNVIFSLIEP